MQKASYAAHQLVHKQKAHLGSGKTQRDWIYINDLECVQAHSLR